MSLPTVSEPGSLSNDTVVLRLENISVRYRIPHERFATLREHAIRWLKRRIRYDDYLALQSVSLQVPRGEMLGIIGPNGAGKSTLLKVVARVLKPKSGRVWICGRVAPLLECGAGFHPELTGRENIFLNGTLLGLTRKEIESKFDGIVDFAELRDFIDAPLRTYSSGMVSRLGFAVATDSNADILIVDEVLSVGDAVFQQKSLDRIQRFRQDGTTILFVSHALDVVETMCDRAIWVHHGSIKACGPAKATVQEYRAFTSKEATTATRRGNAS
jgi:ABC-2 type transport system ATP-binding protein/lipopolysaccharide transport system ATP-binding protein